MTLICTAEVLILWQTLQTCIHANMYSCEDPPLEEIRYKEEYTVTWPWAAQCAGLPCFHICTVMLIRMGQKPVPIVGHISWRVQRDFISFLYDLANSILCRVFCLDQTLTHFANCYDVFQCLNYSWMTRSQTQLQFFSWLENNSNFILI